MRTHFNSTNSLTALLTKHAAQLKAMYGSPAIRELHEMRLGESGSLVVSTPILARYRIGDVIQCVKPPYFRCIGRETNWWTKPHYWWHEASSFNWGRL
jgi:hypothetical protein